MTQPNRPLPELNRKLAEWAGFSYKFGGEWFYEKYKSTNAWWESPEERKFKDLPDFTQSLDACFEWLKPALIFKFGSKKYEPFIKGWIDEVVLHIHEGEAKLFCLALEELIDSTLTTK